MHLEFSGVERGKLLERCLGEIEMFGVGGTACTGINNTDEDATVVSVTHCGGRRQSWWIAVSFQARTFDELKALGLSLPSTKRNCCYK